MNAGWACASVVVLAALLEPASALAQGYAVRFHGNGVNDIDRVKIPVDDPFNANDEPGPPIDVGATDFTLEFWFKATTAANASASISCGSGSCNWIAGNIVVDRDRYSSGGRDFGISFVNGGRVAFGVENGSGQAHTICGSRFVLDGAWHHVAVQRRRSDGWLWVWIDGALDAQANGPDGDLSYPGTAFPEDFCGGPCVGSDPFLVVGAEKHDAGRGSYPPYTGLFDELRVSRALRYTAAFTRPQAPFATDAQTVGLYHFDDGPGAALAADASGVAGSVAGIVRYGGSPVGPEWVGDTPFTGGPPPPTDADGDGLTDAWEATFGLNPASAAGDDGAAGDPDGDGRTNAQERQAGTHPRGFATRYFAEGVVNAFFQTEIALLNPGVSPARVLLRVQPQGQTERAQALTVAAGSRATIDAAALGRLTTAPFASVIESDLPIVADRTMSWDATGYGSHAEAALVAPSTTWYLAEGSTSGDFALFYLLQNPRPVATRATVRFLRPAPLVPIDVAYDLAPNSRTTIPVDEVSPALASTDVSGVVTADDPIIVERAMYLSRPGQPFAAGHGSAGVTATATDWFLAEGATGTFFELFVLVANPSAQRADLRVDYMQAGGAVLTKTYTVAGNSRFTIWVDEEQFPAGSGNRALANASVSMRVRSTNGVGVIVERAMWWPQPSWYEAHNSPASTVTGTEWALAGGESRAASGLETFVLIANTSTMSGQVRVRLFFEDGTTAERIRAIAPQSRTTIAIGSEFPEAADRRYGAIVTSLGAAPAQIVVERAMYASPGGELWTAGSVLQATRLQP